MAAPTVYTDVAEGANLEGQLFTSKKFWVAQHVPSRNRFLELIRSNGGEVVPLEKKADYLIADHCRKNCPPGSISYTFIEKSIASSEIVDPDEHLAGPRLGAAREVGSISRPAKGGRAAFTAEEDRILYTWVRDHERQGGTTSGNELYKQLESKYPRHTWQSWRDRYIKKLKDQPPASLAIPDNAPPSPVSDQSAEQVAPVISVANTTGDLTHSSASQPVTRSERIRTSRQRENRGAERYTVDDFEKLFTKEDWEELYANVATIEGTNFGDYMDAWESWAKGTPQTAEQWRQYYEIVVRPQWKNDTPKKKEHVEAKVAKRHEAEEVEEGEEGEATEAVDPPTPMHEQGEEKAKPTTLDSGSDGFDTIIERFARERKGRKPMEAYMFWAREGNGERKQSVWEGQPGSSYADVHKFLKPQWDALPDGEKAVYELMEAADKKRFEMENNSSLEITQSTVVQETPQNITEVHNKIMKRTRNEVDDADQFSKNDESSHQTKRRKGESSSPDPEVEQLDLTTAGTEARPLELSSGVSSSSEVFEDDEEQHIGLQDQNMEDVIQDDIQTQEYNEDGEPEDELGDDGRVTPTHELSDLQYPQLERVPTTELPSNTPTPNAPRHKSSAFTAQDIPSSPSQASLLAALPRPQQPRAQTLSQSPSIQASSPNTRQESIASTTHSIQEFRRSLNSPTSPTQFQNLTPLPHPQQRPSSSPAPSISSQTSEDHDPPLLPEELDPFFTEQYAHGFNDEEITAALKHTRCRPELAVVVLDAWKDGEPLPDRRGVWSIEDDEDVESGDGVALARLQRKHSLDGWGGVTERLRFLETWRRRQGA